MRPEAAPRFSPPVITEGRSPEATPSFCCIESGEAQRGGAPRLRLVFVALKADGAEGRSPEAVPTQDIRGHLKAQKFGQCCSEIFKFHSIFSQLSVWRHKDYRGLHFAA